MMAVKETTNLPHHSHEEWMRNGYTWQATKCPVKGCGLPVTMYYWPNDPPYRVDPVTMKAHAEVCCNPARVAAYNRAQDAKERERRPARDHKSEAAGDK
jgi:hypothetical protein